MEIIHVVLGKANPERMNGINKVANSLATTMSELGYKVTLWGITANLNHDYPNRNYTTRLFATWKNKFFIPKELKQAINQQTKNSVFHIHGAFVPEFYSIARALTKANFHFVYTPHGAYNKAAINRSWIKKTFYFHFFEKKILKNASYVHLIGKSEVSALNYPPTLNKKILIPNGQENIIKPDKNKSSEEVQFIFCGRLLEKEKGLDLMIEGFAVYLKNNAVKTRLLLLGDGPDKIKLQEKVNKMGIQNAVSIKGATYGDEKTILFSQSHAHLLFSRNEGMPIAVLESTALGIPSIVSEETNMGDFLREYNAGIVIKDNNVASIANAFSNAATAIMNESWNSKIDAGYKMLEEKFCWKKIAMDFIQCYKSIDAADQE